MLEKFKNQLMGTHTQIIEVLEIENKGKNKGVGNQRNNTRKLPQTEGYISILRQIIISSIKS